MNHLPSRNVRYLQSIYMGGGFAPICVDCGNGMNMAFFQHWQAYDSTTGLITSPLCQACYILRVGITVTEI